MSFETDLASAKAEEDYFINGRGNRLAIWNTKAPLNKNIKAILIVIHGTGEHIKLYEELSQSLQTQFGIHLCGFDHIGHGRSDGPRVNAEDFNHYVDDAIDFVKLILNDKPLYPIFIMGHSMGGLILGHMLLRHAEFLAGAVKGFIMHAAAVDLDPATATPFKVLMAKMLAFLFPSFPIGSLAPENATRDLYKVEKLKKDPLFYYGPLRARWCANFLKAVSSINEQMSAITAPMLILHGSGDLTCRLVGSTHLYENIKSADKTIKIYDGAYHTLHYEPDGVKEQFAKDVGDWILDRC